MSDQLFGVRRPGPALVRGDWRPHQRSSRAGVLSLPLVESTQAGVAATVATDQSAARPAHSKELSLPLDQRFLKSVPLNPIAAMLLRGSK